MILLIAVSTSLLALPVLALAMLFIFFFAGYASGRPIFLAVCTIGFALLPCIIVSQTPAFFLIFLPGLVVTAVKLTRSFERISNAADEDE